jgi:imidazolonepropionase-like amidohydrolase
MSRPRLASTCIALACLALSASAFSQANQEVRHTVLMAAKPSGVQTTRTNADGTHEYTFEYNDRGRGPKLTTRIRLDAAGIPVALTTTGNDYMKGPVNEQFTLGNGVARWKNSAESGERKLSGSAFYVSMEGVPDESGLLVNALLKAPGMRLALLPEGEASVKRAAEVTLESGANARKVVAYEINGLGFTPYTVWMDDKQQFFGIVNNYRSVIREGWEESVPKLIKRQDELEGARTLERARTLMRKPTTPVALTNVNLFDAASGQSRPGSTVVIDGNRIVAVGKDGAVTIPSGAERIDGRGRALLPGLWDMHVHLSPDDGLMHIAAGVTSVRDLANDNDGLAAIKRKIESDQEIGPRIVMRGFMDGRGPYTGPTKVFVDNEAEAASAIENYAKLGYDGIKVYSSIKPELVPKIIELAHRSKLRVSGHVPAFMTARQFIEAGADELQHINFVFLNFFFNEVKDTRTPARFTEVAERAATLDLNSAEVRSFVELLKKKGTVVDPTVAIFVAMFTDRPGEVSRNFAAIADRLPPQVRRRLLAGGLPVPEGKDERYRESARALLRMVKLLYDAGVPIVSGTDDLPGFALHRELELYAEAGIPAPDVLRIGTLGSARVAGRAAELGTIEKGKLADLILVDGDPARRISDIRRTQLVIKDGRILETAPLYKSIGVRP